MVHEPTGAKVTSLRTSVAGSPEEAFGDLSTVLDWLEERGVGAGSISSMAWSLWRATLPGKVSIGFDPIVARHAFFGGRQEAREIRTFQHMAAVDIRAAYPTSMAATPYACHLRRVDPSTALDPSAPGIAIATVTVPAGLPFSPLPIRLAPSIIQFPTGRLSGAWAWCELHAAAELGCEVKVKQCFAPTSTVDLFGAWWNLAAAGREELPEGSLDLFKAICNSLWGQFAMDGRDRGIVRWADAKGEQAITVDLEPQRMPHSWTCHIAAETSARVRTRLLREGLYGDGIGYPVHADTDGIIVRASRQLPLRHGDDLGAWRVKATMPKVEIRGPQLYRWLCGKGCGVLHAKWHYTASGIPPDSVATLFDKEPASRVSYRSMFDLCVPTCHIEDRETTRRYLIEAQALGGVR